MSSVRWHLDHLDSLRGIAVISVIISHAFTVDGIKVMLAPFAENLVGSGARGVELFYLVSAFTLFLSYDHRKDEHHPTRNFFLRRFFRLAPMYYITIALAHTIYIHNGVEFIVLAGLFINGFHPDAIYHGIIGGWSVADEAIFYMILPLLFARIRDLRTALWWLFVGTCVALANQRLGARAFPLYAQYFWFFGFVAQLPVFLMGIVGYFIWKDADHLRSKTLSLMILALAAAFYPEVMPFGYKNLYQTGLLGLLLLLGLSFYPWRLLVNPVTIFFGRISYSLYLLHFYPCLYLHRIAKGSPMTQYLTILAVTLAVSTPMAYATWRWVEEPGIRLGRRIIAKLEARYSIPSVY